MDLGAILAQFGMLFEYFCKRSLCIFLCSRLLRMTGGFIKLLFLSALVCHSRSLVESFLLWLSHAFRRFPVGRALRAACRLHRTTSRGNSNEYPFDHRTRTPAMHVGGDSVCAPDRPGCFDHGTTRDLHREYGLQPADRPSHSRWSPDGTQIVFESNRSGYWEVFVMNADGGNQVQITSFSEGGGRWPNW